MNADDASFLTRLLASACISQGGNIAIPASIVNRAHDGYFRYEIQGDDLVVYFTEPQKESDNAVAQINE